MTGRQFEDYVVRILGEHGYWAHRIAPDESGQQPFDIIAAKEDVMCAYDAKVLLSGNRFPLSRIEENQLTSFEIFKKRIWYAEIGCLIYHQGGIRYFSYDEIASDILHGIKSVDARGLPVWRCV